MDRLSTEVLIIGAGAAGLRAAIACCKAGTEVLVVAKTPPGSGTATIISGGGFGFGLAGLSPDEHRARNPTEPPSLDFGPRSKLSYITFDKGARPAKPCRALARKPLSEKEQGLC